MTEPAIRAAIRDDADALARLRWQLYLEQFPGITEPFEAYRPRFVTFARWALDRGDWRGWVAQGQDALVVVPIVALVGVDEREVVLAARSMRDQMVERHQRRGEVQVDPVRHACLLPVPARDRRPFRVHVTRRDPASVATATLSATAGTPVVGSGQSFSFTATVNVSPADPAIQPTRFEWAFGDGSSITTNGPSTSHVYTSGPNSARIVTVKIDLTNGQTLVATTQILLGTF